MIPWPRSLRFRLLGAFVVVALLLGPIVAGLVFTLTHEIEERVVERSLAEYLNDVRADPQQYALREFPGAPGVQVLASVRLDHLPGAMLALEDGVHEYETDGGAWMVALATTPDGRLAVVEDITAMEERERLGFVVVAMAVVLTAGLALLLGFYVSRRVIAPVLELSDRLNRAGGGEQLFLPAGGQPARLAEGFGDDEVGRLARALDEYRFEVVASIQREKSFSAHASHELRNPLSVIQNAAELLEEEPNLSARSQRALERIRHTARRMNETISALLLLVRYRAEPGGREVGLRWCIEDLVENEGAALEQCGEGGGMECFFDFRAEPVVRAPQAAVEIVVRNLVRNALEHSAGTRVDVVLFDDCLVVSDNGQGVDAAVLEEINGTDLSESRERPGFTGGGLGLSLVRRLCQHYGWRLRLDSEAGSGTRACWSFGPTEGQGTPEVT